MEDDVLEIEDNPKAALRSFIRELEDYYYPWYDSATTRNYYSWFVAQALSLLSGFATAVLAATIHQDQIGTWGSAHVFLIVLPLLGTLASTFLLQSRIGELEVLREQGRETVQSLANLARVDFAAASSPEQYTEIHRRLTARVSALEQEQSRGFQRIVPKALTFGSHTPTRK